MGDCPQTEKTVEQRVIELIAFQVGREPEEIGREMRLVKDLGIDSLESTEIVMELEEEFSDDNFELHIPDDDVDRLKTVGQIVDYISKKLPE